jgi:hypothetical protein
VGLFEPEERVGTDNGARNRAADREERSRANDGKRANENDG